MTSKRAFFLLLWIAGVVVAFVLGRAARPDHAEPVATTGRSGHAFATTGPLMSPGQALRLPDPRSANRAFAHAVMSLQTSDEFRSSFEDLLPDFEDPRFHGALFVLADAWGAVAPEDACGWLNALKFNDARNPYLFSALGQWAAKDPEAVLAWLDASHPDPGPTRDYLLAGLVRGSSKRDPDLALKLLLKSPKSPERKGAIDFLLQAWRRVSTDHAMKQVAALPAADARQKQRAIRKLVGNLGPEELESAKTWAGTLASAADRLTARAALAANWSQHDPAAAADWADGLDDAATRSRAYGEIATRWARTDLLAAGRWLAQHTGRADHDLAARAVAWSTVGTDPDTAFSQVSGITDAALRNETFEQLGRLWLSEQPQRAKRFFEGESPIPNPIRERLLDAFE